MTPVRVGVMPRPALILGLAGLLPFFAFALQVATGRPMSARMTGPALYALLLYGAVVLSFLGGIQWGLAVASADRSDAWRRYAFSVVPSFIAWGALWVGGRNGVVALAVGMAVWGVYEVWSTGLGEAPVWYGRLRVVLSVGAVLALTCAAAYGPF